MPQRAYIIFTSLVLLFFACSAVSAATMSLADIAVGQVITVNGMKFAKTTAEGKFMAICESGGVNCNAGNHCLACSTTEVNTCDRCESGYSPVNGVCEKDADTMQTWNGCVVLATPTGTGFTQGPTLTDERDGKQYEIRKFADGKCWMVDNLKYGGGTDGSSDYCASKTGFRDASSVSNATATPTNGLNPADGSRNTLYGDCRSNPDSADYGYLYNWAAAIQSGNGWHGNSSYKPTEPTQGICPNGWHIPKQGEFSALHTATGSPVSGFWQGGNWKGVYSGYCDTFGVLHNQGSSGRYWSSSQNGHYAYYLDFHSSYVEPGSLNYEKNYGHSVRCIKD